MKVDRRVLVNTVAFLIVAALSSGFAPLDLFQIYTRAAGIELSLRSSQELGDSDGRYHKVIRHEVWEPAETVVIVCDMWDSHHCLNAARRVNEMAPQMNEVLVSLRKAGATIIHAPSSCTEPYENHPARVRAQKIPRAGRLPQDIGKWCYQIPSEEQGEYPIDQSDGGEDDDPLEHEQWQAQLRAMGRDPGSPWLRQTHHLEIRDEDYISDDGEEIWSILEHHGADNVILVGVHTNMCVLGRPFGLRQMAKNGKNVVLMRDLTDTMYNPAKAPFVSHFTGTDLIIDHIERYVCPTITSNQILGGDPFRFSKDSRPRLAIVMAEDEYETDITLPRFAAEHLGKNFHISYVFGSEESRNDLPGVDVLDSADVLLVSVRRRLLPPAQLEPFRRFVAAGKPVVGIRTASHAFSARNEEAPDGLDDWPEFDAEVLGGNYTGHHGVGPKVEVTVPDNAEKHAILSGIDVSKLNGIGSLYKVSPLVDSTLVLLRGTIPGKPAEPIAWTNVTAYGGRVFYTSLGHPGDFDQPEFNELLLNALRWAAGVKSHIEMAAIH